MSWAGSVLFLNQWTLNVYNHYFLKRVVLEVGGAQEGRKMDVIPVKVRGTL